jgi:hypothetical protein
MDFAQKQIDHEIYGLECSIGLLRSDNNGLYSGHTPYGVKTSTEETKNKYPGFSTIYEQKSKFTMLEIWRVILKRSIQFR